MKSDFTFPVATRKACLLCLLFTLMVWNSYGQACTNCPSIADCGACAGGLRTLTFQYTGGGLAVSFSALDGNGQNVGGGLLSPTITINSAGGPTQPFGGGSVTLTVLTLLGDLVTSQTVNTSCVAPIYDGSVFGSFKILGGISVDGGILCCSPTEMESIPDPVFAGCPGDQTLPIISGCTRTATWTPPTATDGCGDPITVSTSHAPNFAFPVGPTVVTYTATDPYGNTNTCEFTITITDGILPQFVNCLAPRDEPVNTNCQFQIPDYTSLVTASDNCDTSVEITQNPLSGTVLSGLGTVHNITLTAKDDSNNIRTCIFAITLADQTAPQISCPGDFNVAANHPTNCSYTIPDFTDDATATDNCDANVSVVQSPLPGSAVITGEGAQQVITMTAYDDIGNSSQCTFTITLIDTTNPQILCPADKNESVDVNCEFSIPDYRSDATAFDKCDGDVEITQSPLPGTVINGVATVQTITLTAKDNANNIATCNFNVTLIDLIPPAISCPADFDVFTGTNNCSFSIPSYTHLAIASDNCDAVVTVNQSPAVGTIMTGHGDTEVITLTAFDISGNSNSCNFTITLKDNVAPQITSCAPDQEVAIDINCEFLVPNYTSLATATDNCDSNVTITQSPLAGTVLTGVGTTMFTFTATDDGGNSTTCNFEVTVIDDIDPVIANCPSPINVNSNTSSCGTIVNWTAPTSSDNCSVASFTSTHNPGSTFPVGTTTVTYTATDASGNVSTCSFDVVVSDITLPVITNLPTNRTVTLASTECTKVVTWTPPSATDNCPAGLTFTSTHNSGQAFPFGTTQVTYTAKDASGNTATYSFNVTVNDVTNPQIVGCSHGAIQEVTATAACNSIPVWTPPTATDNCAVTLASTHNLGDIFPLGKTDVTYTATDQAGNTATCTFKILVKDKTAPVITGCVATDIIEQANASCEAIASWIEPTASDNCSVILTKTHSPGDVFPLGTTTVTYTATDGSANIATCSFNVVVKDETAPVISGCISSDIIVAANESCEAIASWNEPIASDNCAVTMTSSHIPGQAFSQGTTIVTYTATDNSGNIATCSFNVIVKDETNPVISGCISTQIVTIANESCEAIVNWTPPIATDNCQTVTLSSTHNPGDVFQKGTTVVTYTATDGAGNKTTCTFDVVVNDETKPEIEGTITSDLVTIADSDGVISVDWTELTCYDNCGVVTMTSSHSPGTIFPIGTTVVTYTATDNAGNTTITSFNVVVEDKSNPAISGCPTSDIMAEASASCETIVNWNALTSTDNSGTSVLTKSHEPGQLFPLGTTVVSYTATDPSGNTSTCEFNVVVKDETAPVISRCIASDIVVPATASCTAIVNWDEPTASDNCDVTLTTSHQPGTAFETGTTEVTYTATDGSGNTAVCKFNVIVEDETAPVMQGCVGSDIIAATEGSCSAIVTWTEPTVADCSSVTLTSTHQPGTAFPVGSTEVVYTAEDIHGNFSFCKFNIIVEDKTAPVFTNCSEKIVVKADASCNPAVTWPVPDLSDNCEVANVTSTHRPGDFFPIGITPVKYTAIDGYGNISYCEFLVEVQNVNPPSIEGCVDDIVAKAGESGEVQIQWVPPTATVQCGEITLVGSHNPGDYFPLGITEVEYKATDEGGNIALCTFTVDVSYEEVQFDVVNILTPDGDGINDEWVLGNIEKFSQNKVVIVDRWGSVIFSATGYNNSNVVWKGSNSSGAIVPTGTYFYTISVRIGPEVHEKRGFIELIQ